MKQKLVNGEWVDAKKVAEAKQREPVDLMSENLGFGKHDLKKFKAHKKAHGFTGVEFKEDARVPGYYNVHFSGPDERARYEKSRCLANMSGENGGSLLFAPGEFDQAVTRTLAAYPIEK